MIAFHLIDYYIVSKLKKICCGCYPSYFMRETDLLNHNNLHPLLDNNYKGK